MDRKQAIAAGQTHYSTGKPCSRGHYAMRYVSTGNCVQCQKEASGHRVRAVNTARAANAEGNALLMYKLHRDDYAKAWAYCQALDMARGRTPQSLEPLPPASGPVQLPPWLVQKRRELAEWEAQQRRPHPTNGA